MEVKEYIFDGNKYTMLSDSLDLLNNANDMLVYYRKQVYKYMSDLDFRELTQYNADLKKLKDGLIEAESSLEEADEEKAKEININIENIKGLITEKENEFNDNIALINMAQLKSDCENAIIISIMSDKALMKKTIKGILKGDFSKINFESPDIFKFIREVILDFFIFMGNSNLSA